VIHMESTTITRQNHP